MGIFKNAVSDLYPGLNLESFISIEGGDDFYVFEANEDLIFRFAKSHIGIEKLKFEIEILPKLQYDFPVKVPEYIYYGFIQPSFSFVGYKKIEGTPFKVSKNKSNTDCNAEIISNIFERLYEFKSTDKVTNRLQTEKWKTYFIDLVFKIRAKGMAVLSDEISARLNDKLTRAEQIILNYDFSPSLIHSDFKSSHILCNEENIVVGLIDWGDSTYGDPTFDLARILDEFGYDFFLKVMGNVDSKLSIDVERVFIYSVLIPFLIILKGITFENKELILLGTAKLNKNLSY